MKGSELANPTYTPPLNIQKISEFEQVVNQFLQTLGIQDGYKVVFHDLSQNVSVDLSKKVISFDQKIVQYTGLNGAIPVILHDLYHVFMQNIPHNKEVKEVRDVSPYFMNTLDTEADLEMFQFMQKTYKWTFEDFTKVIFESTRFFHDDEPRMPKFERFLSALISIYISDHVSCKLPIGIYECILNAPGTTKKIFIRTGRGVKYIKFDLSHDDLDTLLTCFQSTVSDYTVYNSSIETILERIIPQLQENFSLIQKMITENKDAVRLITSPQPYMEKQHIIDTVSRYHPTYDEERVYKKATLDFVEQNDLLAHRTNLTGHITGSAWVVDPTYTQALLIHHLKLNKWVQPGGHGEHEDTSLQGISLREAKEEIGIDGFRLVSPEIYDLDVHTIPARGEEPEHPHYDIRFLLTLDDTDLSKIDPKELKGAQWVNIDLLLTDPKISQSIRRMAEKSVALR